MAQVVIAPAHTPSPETPSAPIGRTEAILRANLESPISNQGMGLNLEAPAKMQPELDLSTQIAAIHEFNRFCKIMNEYKQKDSPLFREDKLGQMALAVWEKQGAFFSSLDDEKWAAAHPSHELSITNFSDGERIVMQGVMTRMLDELAAAEGYVRTRPHDRIPRNSLAPTSKKPGEFDLVADDEIKKEKKKEEVKKSASTGHDEHAGDHADQTEGQDEQAHGPNEKRAYSYRTQPPETPEQKKSRFSLFPRKEEAPQYQAPMELGDLVRAGYLQKIQGSITPGSLPPTEQRYVGSYAEKINFLKAYNPSERAQMLINLQNTEVAFREQVTGLREKINPFYRNRAFARDDLHRITQEELTQLARNEGVEIGKIPLRRRIEMQEMANTRAVQRLARDVVDYTLEKQKTEGESNRADLIDAAQNKAARERGGATESKVYKKELEDGSTRELSEKDYKNLVKFRIRYEGEKTVQEGVKSAAQKRLDRKTEIDDLEATKSDRLLEILPQLSSFTYTDTTTTPPTTRSYNLHIPTEVEELARIVGAIPVVESRGTRLRLPTEVSQVVQPIVEQYMKLYNEQTGLRTELGKIRTEKSIFTPTEVTAIKDKINDADEKIERYSKVLIRVGTPKEPETVTVQPENIARREFMVGDKDHPNRFTELFNDAQATMYSPERRRSSLQSFRDFRRALVGTYPTEEQQKLVKELFSPVILINNLSESLGIKNKDLIDWGLVEKKRDPLTGRVTGEVHPKTGRIDFSKFNLNDPADLKRYTTIINRLEKELLARMGQLTPESSAEIAMSILQERLRAAGNENPKQYTGNEHKDRIRLRQREVRPVPLVSGELPEEPDEFDLIPNI